VSVRSASPRRDKLSARLLAKPGLLPKLADLFHHLSDPRRLQLLLLLARREHAVSELAGLLRVTPSAVSHQLQTLRQARLVAKRREGKTAYYHLDDDHVRLLVEMAREHVLET